MILSCPACSTRFVIDDARFGIKRRRVRCGQCAHEWHAEPPANPAPRVATTPIPSIMQPIPVGSNLPALRPEEKTTTYQQPLKIAVALMMILALLGALLFFKPWQNLPHDHAVSTLALTDIKTRYEVQQQAEGEPAHMTLIVEGLIRNNGNTPMTLPPVVVEVRGKDGLIVARATAALQSTVLDGGQTTSFLQDFQNPPDNLTNITVAFEPEIN